MKLTSFSPTPAFTGSGRIMARSSLALMDMLYTTNWRPSSAARAKMLVALTERTGREKQHIGSASLDFFALDSLYTPSDRWGKAKTLMVTSARAHLAGMTVGRARLGASSP